jgi:hypothetical protein
MEGHHYHPHPLLNAFISLAVLAGVHSLDYVGLQLGAIHEGLAILVQLIQVGLFVIAAINFYWAWQKRNRT